MNDELLTKALLAGRIERSVTFDSRLLYDTYQTYFAKMELNAPKMIICNSLKNRTCFSVANKSPVLIFDYYIIEIIGYLNEVIDKDLSVMPLFYKIFADYSYLHGNYGVSYIYKNKYMKIINCKKNINKKFNDQTNKFILDMQTVFILNHEICHYYYYTKPDELQNEIDNIIVDLAEIMEYLKEEISKKEIIGEWNKNMESYISKRSNLEESICDKFAAIKAMEWAVLKNHVLYEEYMAHIIISLCNQFAVSVIYSYFDGDLLENINAEFDTRMFYLYITMYDYLYKKQILSDDVKYSELYQSLYDNWNRKVFEPIIMLCNEEMDNRMENKHRIITEQEKVSLLAFLKKVNFK